MYVDVFNDLFRVECGSDLMRLDYMLQLFTA